MRVAVVYIYLTINDSRNLKKRYKTHTHTDSNVSKSNSQCSSYMETYGEILNQMLVTTYMPEKLYCQIEHISKKSQFPSSDYV